MSYFDDCFDRLMGHEGMYSSHSADPGNETMWGVTATVARGNGYTGPMRSLPRDVARAIYRVEYWGKARCEDMPRGIAFDVFDGAVNSGVSQSVRWLQRAAGVADDGHVGPVTLSAVAAASPALLQARYNGLRLEFMTQLSNWSSFSRGWASRIAQNLQRVGA